MYSIKNFEQTLQKIKGKMINYLKNCCYGHLEKTGDKKLYFKN